MTRTLHVFLLLLAIPVLPGTMAAQGEVGGYAGGILRRGLTAAEVGRGGAFIPFDVDASAIFSNSASLARMENAGGFIAAAPTSFAAQRTATLGAATPVGEFAGVGISIANYSLASIPSTQENGRRVGTITYQEFSLSVAGALTIGPASIGTTIHYLRNDASGVGNPSGYAVDLSGTMSFGNRLYFAVALNNLAGEMRGIESGSSRDVIPWYLRGSVGYVHPFEERGEVVRPDPSGIPVARQLTPKSYALGVLEGRISEVDSTPVVALGFEVVPTSFVDLGARVGLNSLGDISFGILYSLPLAGITDKARIDLTVRRDYEIGDLTYHFALGLAL